MKDYSQHGEQAHILKFFNGFIGRFLDLGAYDGVSGSNTAALAQLGWSGVSFEPNPAIFPMLLKTAPHTIACCNAAVMNRPGLLRFFDTDGQCGTCMENHSLNTLVKRFYWVSAVTPQMIADVFGGNFDFISLDVEGVDLEVLSDLAPLASKARLLCFEDSIPCRVFDQDYYNRLIEKANALGFNRVILRSGPTLGSGNTLIAK